MHRLSYVIAALAVIALVSPSLAEDAPKAGQTAKTERSSPAGGEARHEGGKIGGSGDRAGMQAKAGLAGTVPARNKSSSAIADIIITAIITTQCKDDGLGNEAIRSVTT